MAHAAALVHPVIPAAPAGAPPPPARRLHRVLLRFEPARARADTEAMYRDMEREGLRTSRLLCMTFMFVGSLVALALAVVGSGAHAPIIITASGSGALLLLCVCAPHWEWAWVTAAVGLILGVFDVSQVVGAGAGGLSQSLLAVGLPALCAAGLAPAAWLFIPLISAHTVVAAYCAFSYASSPEAGAITVLLCAAAAVQSYLQERRLRRLFLLTMTVKDVRTAEAASVAREAAARDSMMLFERSFGYICTYACGLGACPCC